MNISKRELKKHLRQAKILLRTMKKLYRTGVAFKMAAPAKELWNAEKMVEMYERQVKEYEA